MLLNFADKKSFNFSYPSSTTTKQNKPPFSFFSPVFSNFLQKLKMLKKHSVEGFEAFQAKIEELKNDDCPTFIYFSGSKTSGGMY